MKEIYYIYNNEAIASCVLLSVLNSIDSIDIARSCLILPFLLDDQTVNYLRRNKSIELNLVQLIEERARLFSSFNKRYQALLPVTINALMILKKSNQIEINSNILSSKNTRIQSNMDVGERLELIMEVMPFFLAMTEKYSTIQLYEILNIQL